MVGIDDIVAALLMSLAMMRRLEVLGVSREDNPAVTQTDFDRWRALALRGYNLAAGASLAKVVLSLSWFLLVREPVFLQVGGITIFGAWVLAMVTAWRNTTEASAQRKDLGILGRRH
jgi:hypothetical protein